MDEVDATVRPEVAGSSGESTGALEAVACANCENIFDTVRGESESSSTCDENENCSCFRGARSSCDRENFENAKVDGENLQQATEKHVLNEAILRDDNAPGAVEANETVCLLSTSGFNGDIVDNKSEDRRDVLNTDGLNNQLSGAMNSECHLLEQVSQNPDLIERSDLAEVSYKNFIFIIPRKVVHTCSESCFSYEATPIV